MGAIWLDGRTAGYPNVVGVLRSAGVTVVEQPGWQNRSRSSGGFDAFLGVVCHHTASQTTPANDINFMLNGDGNPISNGLLDRTGTFTIIAGGASNHAGKGGPLGVSRGTIPLDAANSRCFGIEAANNGVGEVWPMAQQSAYTRMVRALAGAYGLALDRGWRDVFAHWEWTTRKCDPAGPSQWSPRPTGGCSERNWFDMAAFRASAAIGGAAPGPNPPTGDDDVAYLYSDPRYTNVWVIPSGINVDGAGAAALTAQGVPSARSQNDHVLSACCHTSWGITGGTPGEIIALAVKGGMLVPA